MNSDQPLWTPSDVRQDLPLRSFMSWCAGRYGSPTTSVDEFHEWSVREPEQFWSAIWQFCGVKGEPGTRVLVNGGDMLGARFFPDARLNFAENLLSQHGAGEAIIFRGENKARDTWSWDRLRDNVSRLQQAMRAAGIREGDRVAAMMPNMPETVALMLAAASIGADLVILLARFR
jgi:acetoacetyl-CoA synthetase